MNAPVSRITGAGTTNPARLLLACLVFGLAIAVIAAVVTTAFAADPPGGRKLNREIRVMERALDELMIDSPNFLVRGYDNARGLYVPGTGAIFTVDASFTATGWPIPHKARNAWFFWDDDDDDDEDENGDRRGGRSRRQARLERQYERGTKELMEFLGDEAETMSSLKTGEWVQVVVFFNDVDYLWDKDIDHLVVKAKIDDLRAHAGKSLSEDQLLARIVKEEY